MKQNRGNLIVFLLVSIIVIAGGLAIAYFSQFEPDRDGLTLSETLAQTESVSQFNSLLQQSGVLAELESSESDYTIFAPTNAALEKAKKQLDKLSGDEQKDALAALLRNHIIEERVFSFSLQTAEELDTIGDEVLPVRYDQEKQILRVGGAIVGESDIRANNGMIHEVDALVKVREE